MNPNSPLSVTELLRVYGGSDPAAAKAAGNSLRRRVHEAARPGARGEAQAVSRELAIFIGPDQPRHVRADALRYLGFVGGRSEVGAIAAQLTDLDVREDARLALERLPDRQAERALRDSLKTVPADYRPAVEQSLRHRRRKWREVGIAS